MLTIGLLLTLMLPLPPGGPAARWYTGSDIGPGYLDAAGTNARGKAHLLTESRIEGAWIGGGGIDELVATAPGGPRADYCNYARLGKDSAGNDSVFLDTPRSNFAEGDGHPDGSTCTAQGRRWSWRLRGLPSTQHCSGTDAQSRSNVPCNMHHFASDAAGGLADRPWDSSRFGPFPSFVVETDVTAGLQRVLQGGWGFVCPMFVDTSVLTSRTEAVEFCIEEWRFGTLFPTLPGGSEGFDVAPAESASAVRAGRGYALDQVVTAVEPGRAFVSIRPGSGTTWEGPGAHHLAFAISRANMAAALHAINAAWGRGISEEPSDYAYVGIEEGIEGGAVAELSGSAANLSAMTTTDTLYAGQTLTPGQVLRSPDGVYALVLRGDGNLVVYDADGAVRWATATPGNPGASLVLQGDGNLVLSSAFGEPLWSSGTASSGATDVILGDDGRLVAYAGTTPRWSSGDQDATRTRATGPERPVAVRP